VSDFVDQLKATAAAALLPTDGKLEISGLAEPVEIRRDTWGVPYIRASSTHDLWFAQGVVSAGERLFQIDMALRAAGGRLSEVFSDRTLDADKFARTVGLNRAGARIAEAWDERSRAMHARFRDGVFAWIEAMPAPPVEYMLLDFSPELPRDEASWAAAFAYLAWGLSGNWDRELLRTWTRDRLGDEAVEILFPQTLKDPVGIAGGALHGALPYRDMDAILNSIPRHEGQGSNNWVVAGSRTASGKPMLANDPHLLALQPGVWLECHLSAPGYEARGVALTFSPGILLGTTAHHAWGVTNVTGDVQDLYLERLNVEWTAAEYEGSWEPLTIHDEQISVRGAESVHLVVRETRHGPLLGAFVSGDLNPDFVALAPAETYALRWTGAQHGIRPSLAVDVADASNFEEFRRAALQVECPGQNFVYADVEGTIGYTCTGRYPVRAKGDGGSPVPGWNSEHEWQGSIPMPELPWAKDPDCAFLVTANNKIHDDDYPHMIGRDFHTPHRARRIAQALAGAQSLTIEDMTRLQNDTVSLPALTVLPLLLELEPATDEQRSAIDLLGAWDADMSADSQAAAVFNTWSRAIARRVLEPKLGEDLFRHYHAWRELFQCEVLPGLLRLMGEADAWIDGDLFRAALDEGLAELRERAGTDAPTWGDLHRLRLEHPLASIPGLESLFVAAEIPLGGDEATVMAGGFDGRDGYQPSVIASWRVVYDLADLDRSVGVLPAGISGNPASPHWNDQSELYAQGRYHPLAFTTAAVEAATVATLTLVPYHP
jgi:penicillin G amidase